MWCLVHCLITFPAGLATFDESLKCNIRDKGGKKEQLGCTGEMQLLSEINNVHFVLKVSSCSCGPSSHLLLGTYSLIQIKYLHLFSPAILFYILFFCIYIYFLAFFK